MKELLTYSGLSIAVIACIAGQITLGRAKEYVKTNFPKLFEEYSDYGLPVLKTWSPKENRVRRALAKKMLIGSLPQEVKTEQHMAEYIRLWRLCLLGIVAGFGFLIVAVR